MDWICFWGLFTFCCSAFFKEKHATLALYPSIYGKGFQIKAKHKTIHLMPHWQRSSSGLKPTTTRISVAQEKDYKGRQNPQCWCLRPLQTQNLMSVIILQPGRSTSPFVFQIKAAGPPHKNVAWSNSWIEQRLESVCFGFYSKQRLLEEASNFRCRILCASPCAIFTYIIAM